MTFNEFTEKFKIKLNKHQARAVTEIDGPVLLLSVPGSGKTTVVVSRIGYMLYCLGLNPDQILTMTYTVAATADMRARFRKLFGDEFADRLEFRTINGVCAIIINYYSRSFNRQPFELVTDDGALNKILRDIYIASSNTFPAETDIKEIRTSITYVKNMMLSGDEIDEIEIDGINFSDIYAKYCHYLSSHRLMDYDDQMSIALMILKKHPSVLKYFQNRYTYINVDEAQDTSKIQHMLIRLLASQNRNIFMVGDEDQSIYGFRAAYPQALLEFERIYPDGKVLYMETNYRCDGEIVSCADKFIKQNHNRHPKNMIASRKAKNKVCEIKLTDYNKQYSYLLSVAKKNDSQTAVLFRNNESAIPIIDILEKSEVSYYYRQRESFFFSHYIVRDILSFFRLSREAWNTELFLESYYKFDIKIKRDLLTDALRHRRKSARTNVIDDILENGDFEAWQIYKLNSLKLSLASLMKGSSYGSVNKILYTMGYASYLESRKADMTKVNILLSLANQNPDIKEFLTRTDELKKIIDNGAGEPESRFILSTIHSSKGLEYDHVIIIDAIDGVLPAIQQDEEMSDEDKDKLEEERRLFYVGITRAKNRLELITYSSRFGNSTNTKSSFINQLLSDKKQISPVLPIKRKASGTMTAISLSPEKIQNILKDYYVGAMVKHRIFGRGEIKVIADNIATIEFGQGSERKLDLALCIQKGILTLAV